MDVTYIGALIAGLLSFLSPCVLPLVPPYLCFLGGTTFDQLTGEDETPSHVYTTVVLSSVAFVLGFTTVFVILGATATAAGQLLAANLPHARLIADANEAWQPHETESLLAIAAAEGVELVEQPLPAGDDALLARIARPVPVCADESVHDRASLAALVGCYDAVNIKLDKTGGLTEALLVAERARALGLKIMVGSMVATSLAMAPALILAQDADWVDLDGPLLLERDRVPGLRYDGATIFPPEPSLWG